jgi:hypothetical protein
VIIFAARAEGITCKECPRLEQIVSTWEDLTGTAFNLKATRGTNTPRPAQTSSLCVFILHDHSTLLFGASSPVTAHIVVAVGFAQITNATPTHCIGAIALPKPEMVAHEMRAQPGKDEISHTPWGSSGTHLHRPSVGSEDASTDKNLRNVVVVVTTSAPKSRCSW